MFCVCMVSGKASCNRNLSQRRYPETMEDIEKKARGGVWTANKLSVEGLGIGSA